MRHVILVSYPFHHLKSIYYFQYKCSEKKQAAFSTLQSSCIFNKKKILLGKYLSFILKIIKIHKN